MKIKTALAGTAATLLVLTGCASETKNNDGEETEVAQPPTESEAPVDAEPGDEQNGSSDSNGEAVFTVGDEVYTAKLAFCHLAENEDALFHGVATDSSGAEVGYLEGDFGIQDGTAFGEARIDFGATQKMQSTDEFVAIGEAVGALVFTDFSDTSWYAIGTAWNENGDQTPSSSIKINCE